MLLSSFLNSCFSGHVHIRAPMPYPWPTAHCTQLSLWFMSPDFTAKLRMSPRRPLDMTWHDHYDLARATNTPPCTDRLFRADTLRQVCQIMLAISIEQCHKLPKNTIPWCHMISWQLWNIFNVTQANLLTHHWIAAGVICLQVSADSSGKKNRMAQSLKSHWQEGHLVHEWLHEQQKQLALDTLTLKVSH